MRRIIAGLIIGGLLIFGPVPKSFGFDDGDFQIWYVTVEEFKINDRSFLSLEQEIEFGDNAHDFYDHEYGIGYHYDVKDWLELSLHYRHILEKEEGKFLIENRPHVDAKVKWKMAGFKFSNRSRIQYSHFDYTKDTWCYRNKLKADFPWKFTRFEIQPFVAEEPYLKFDGKSFYKNRFFSGVKCKLTKNVEVEFYYLLQHCREIDGSTTHWPHINVFGSELILSF